MKFSKSVLLWFVAATLLLTVSACAQPTPTTLPPSSTSSTSPTPTSTTPPPPTNVRLGIFIPGALGDSPPYDALADSAKKMALRDKQLTVDVFEAGFDQSKWVQQLTSYAASGKFDVIYTSNEALGPMAVQVVKQVPNIKFIINDSYIIGNDRIATTFFNKYQESYLYGYMMALVSTSTMAGANSDKKIGLVYGQHYTMMDDLIIPGIDAGAKAVDPAFEVKTAMLGNWYDAKKAESLANSLIDEGVDCIGTIAGSGNAGVLRAATDRGVYVCWYDTEGFDKAPGTVVGTVLCFNGDATVLNLEDLLAGSISWGKPRLFDAQEGYIAVPLRAPGWVNNVPEDTRLKFEAEYNKVLSGERKLPIPQAVLDKLDAAAKGGS